MTPTTCQRWRHRRDSYRPAGGRRGMPDAQPYPCACPVCCPTLARSVA